MKGTKDIAPILKERNTDGRYDAIIRRAELNGYHDHKFTKVPGHPEYGECICPKLQLVHDLAKFPELSDISHDVKKGVYDEPADAEDQKEMRGWLLKDNAPDGMFKELGFDVPKTSERLAYKKQHN